VHQAEQTHHIARENRQRLLTLELASRAAFGRSEKITERLEQHGKSLSTSGAGVAAVRIVADKAHEDITTHEDHHRKIYDNNYVQHAHRIALLEELVQTHAAAIAVLMKAAGITATAAGPGQRNGR
jgi:hypothetical protein